MEKHNDLIKGTLLCCSLVVLLQAIALALYLNPDMRLLEQLVPFHLLPMLVLIIWNQPDKSIMFWVFLIATFFAGIIVELLGITTGFIFGEYTYGLALGAKIAEVPVMMGVFWAVLIYSVSAFLKNFDIKNHSVRAMIGAFLLVLLDVMIEPVAIKYDYWNWTHLDIPFQNYFAWFIFSFAMLSFLFQLKFNKRNPAATILLITQLLFYAALNLWAF